MGKNTSIAWCEHTFNGWWGCIEVSPECDECYARKFAKRVGHGVWGKDAPRRFFGDAHWNEPRQWNAAAKAAGVRARVFCSSMSDVLERRADLVEPRNRLWALAEECDSLDWMFLTKRPGNFKTMVPKAWMTEGGWPAHIWPGTTIGVRSQLALRAPALCKLPSLQKFLSMEPLLDDVAADEELFSSFLVSGFDEAPFIDHVTLVISGGESGGKARPSLPDWHRRIARLCAQYGTAYNFKQWGEWAPGECAQDAPSGTEQVASWFNDQWSFSRLTPRQSEELHVDDEPDLFRFGKKAAGRLLDGVEYNGVPAPRTWEAAA